MNTRFTKIFPLLVFALFLVVIATFFYISQNNSNETKSIQETKTPDPLIIKNTENKINNTQPENLPAEEENIPETVTQKPKTIIYEVPFTSQAPFAEWDNPIFQDGCEEVSLIMAMRWINNNPALSKTQAKKEILEIVEFEKKLLGNYLDTSAKDTAKVMEEYYGYNNIEIMNITNIEDIKKIIMDGNIALIPMNGQKLNNPNFKPPGPENHMVVVIGHDPTTKKFIVNDPGTRNGAQYRYSEETIFEATRDYPTGHHELNLEINKVAIIVSK